MRDLRFLPYIVRVLSQIVKWESNSYVEIGRALAGVQDQFDSGPQQGQCMRPDRNKT